MKLSELKKLVKEMPTSFDPKDEQQRTEFLRAQGMEPGRIYQELEMDSPLVDTHGDTSFSNAQIQIHSHNFYELIYCRNDCGAEYLVGSERYRLREGDIVFIPPGVSHRPLLPENMTEPYRRFVLWLSPEFMVQYARLFSRPFSEQQPRVSMLRTGGTQWASLRELFREGVREAEQKAEGWEAAVVGNTILLLSRIRRATEEQDIRQMKAEKPELLDRIAAYVEQNYASPISVSDVARQFYVSNSTVSHLFREKMGVSFYRYVTQRRLIAAKTLIEKGLLLENVAVQTGFADYSGFYRAFRQEYGISPRQYRMIQETAEKISAKKV